MHDLIVQITSNILRLSIIDKDKGLLTHKVDIPKDLVNDTTVNDVEGFSTFLGQQISQFTEARKNKLSMTFIIEPENVILKYVYLPKNVEGVEKEVLSQASDRLDGINLEDLYFDYQKIAPFIFQFIAIRKDLIEKYLEISSMMGIELKALIPWSLVLPDLVNVSDSCAFIVKQDKKEAITLSELGGVFFSETYEDGKMPKDIISLTKDLAFYKRKDPINCIFTLGYEHFNVKGFQMSEIPLPKIEIGSENLPDFEINVLVNYALDTSEDALTGTNNMLNLLPVPVTQNNTNKVAVIAALGTFVLIAGIFGAFLFLKPDSNTENREIAQSEDIPEQVLSESVVSETIDDQQEDTTENEENNEAGDAIQEYKKGALTIRVENGSGMNGLAAKTQDFLREKGYVILEIDTANISTDKTILRFSGEFVDYQDLIIKDMEENFPEIEVQDTLSEDEKYNLLIILGSTSEL